MRSDIDAFIRAGKDSICTGCKTTVPAGENCVIQFVRIDHEIEEQRLFCYPCGLTGAPRYDYENE